MLKGLLKNNEEKIRTKVEEHFNEGMRMLTEKFFNGAMVEFDKAMALHPELAYPRLRGELDKFALSGQLESALSIGMNLIKRRKSDFELANKLGNYARELKNYAQAEGLYKISLAAKANYAPAFYNLAASMARVEKYDSAAQSCMSVFSDLTDYVLPDYIGGLQFMESLTAELDESKATRIDEQLQELELKKESAESSGSKVEAEECQLEIAELKEAPKHATPEDVLVALQNKIQANEADSSNAYYNLALFALSINRLEIAEEALTHLNSDKFDYFELLKAVLLAKQGKNEEAIQAFVAILGINEFNRYGNVNIGLLYRKLKKKFVATKYLIKTASLLEKSGGLYSMKELIALAHASYNAEDYTKALSYYKIACTENPDNLLWERMGNIYAVKKKYDDATACYKKILANDPDSEIGNAKLMEMHDYYFRITEKLWLDNKFKPAADYVHKALRVIRRSDTIQLAAKIYGMLKQPEKEQEFKEEYRKILEIEKVKKQEEERQQLVKLAKAYMIKKNYLKAIETLESALRMKVDQKIFIQLAGLYKGLKKENDLQDLIRRWEKMVKHEEKMQKFAKEQERKEQGKEKGDAPEEEVEKTTGG